MTDNERDDEERKTEGARVAIFHTAWIVGLAVFFLTAAFTKGTCS